MRKAILASQNKNKIKEIRAILERYGFDVISRDDAGLPRDDIEETGTTFEENSYIKARAIYDMIRQEPGFEEYLHSPVIADDSGLMVDALGGAPGVYSARYAGEGCSYDDNNVKLLGALDGVPYEDRTASMTTFITMLFPDAEDAPAGAVFEEDLWVLRAGGILPGHIGLERRGTEGFGYDPLFIPEGQEKTFAELGVDYKNSVSHRARALAELERLLEEK